MNTPRFTKEHEWIVSDGELMVCGISDFAQKALGDIVYVELPATGRHVKQGESVAVVESAKAASEVYAPIDGEVTAINELLSTDPAIVNSDPRSAGWFFKLIPLDQKQLDALMDEPAYEGYLADLKGH